MATAIELIAQKKRELAELEAAAEAEIAAGKQDDMAEVVDHLKQKGISIAELVQFARTAGSKYSQPGTKNTWSGKGKKPAWVVAALAKPGTKLEDLLTTKPAPAASAE